jgi:hypothetical protein
MRIGPKFEPAAIGATAVSRLAADRHTVAAITHGLQPQPT